MHDCILTSSRFKGTTFDVWVLRRGVFNFCVCGTNKQIHVKKFNFLTHKKKSRLCKFQTTTCVGSSLAALCAAWTTLYRIKVLIHIAIASQQASHAAEKVPRGTNTTHISVQRGGGRGAFLSLCSVSDVWLVRTKAQLDATFDRVAVWEKKKERERDLWFNDLLTEQHGDKLKFVFSPDIILVVDWAQSTYQLTNYKLWTSSDRSIKCSVKIVLHGCDLEIMLRSLKG